MGLLIASDAAYPGVATLTLAGEIDLTTAEQLGEAIVREINRDDVAAVLLDLDHVTFLDSTGLAALVKGRRAADQRGKRIAVTNAHGLVRRVLDATGPWNYLTGTEYP